MKKRAFRILLAICVVVALSLLAMPTATVQALGTTTVNGQSYYQIGSAQDLMDFAAKVNGGETGISAILTADIDMSGKTWTPMGTYAAPYSGNFDGDGHRIYNLNNTKFNTYLEENATYGHTGLFGSIEGAGVQNLTLEATANLSIADSSLNHYRVGLLVGQMRDSIIYNCTTKGSVVLRATDSSGNITTNTTTYCVGGMLGHSQHSIMINCGNEASVTTSGNTNYAAGGLVGYMTAGYDLPLCMLNSYNTGAVDVNAQCVGGLAGYFADDAVNNYSTGTVKNAYSTGSTGLLFGEIANFTMAVPGDSTTTSFTPVIRNNYYLSGGTAIGKLNAATDTTINSSGYATAFSSGNLTGSFVGTLNGNLATVEKVIAGHMGYLTTSQWSSLISKLNGKDVQALAWHVEGGKPVPSACSFTDGVCACGALNIVASTTIKGTTTEHLTLNAAIQAVANCTASDKAVVTILKDIELGNSYQQITSGVFTIDLNGCEISSTKDIESVLRISNAAVSVTIQDSGEGGCIRGYDAVKVYDATLTITGGSFVGTDSAGLRSYRSNTTVTGGSFSGWEKGLVTSGGTVTISAGSFSGGYSGLHAQRGSVTITGGSFTGGNYGDIFLDSENGTITLTLGKNGVGATFPGGIDVRDTTLNAILGEGAAYWKGSTMIIPADDAIKIDGGDVVIKAACQHTGNKTYTNNGDNHSYTYSCCNATVTEGHTGGTATCTTQAVCVHCGASYGELADHTDETVPGYDATCTESGLTEGVKCAVCDEVLSAQEEISATGEHTYANGVCTVCGATEDPTADANLKFMQSPSLSFQDYIGMQLMMTKKLAGNYDKVYVEAVQVTPEGEVTTTLNPITYLTNYYVFDQQIMAWSMTETVTLTLYAEKDGKTYVGQTYTQSVESLALAMMEKYSTNTTICRMLVDMLNYGAAVQTQFSHNAENLPNTQLGDFAAMGSTNIPECDATNTKTGTATVKVINDSVSMQAKVEIQLVIKGAVTATPKATIGTTVLNPVLDTTSIKGYTVIRVAIAATQMRETVTIALYDENDAPVTQVYNVSVEGYAVTAITGSQKDVVIAMMRYGDSVRAFANQ